jgi:hypothetical protein
MGARDHFSVVADIRCKLTAVPGLDHRGCREDEGGGFIQSVISDEITVAGRAVQIALYRCALQPKERACK